MRGGLLKCLVSWSLVAAPWCFAGQNELPEREPPKCAGHLNARPPNTVSRLHRLKIALGFLRASYAENAQAEGHAYAFGDLIYQISQMSRLTQPESRHDQRTIALPSDEILKPYFQTAHAVIGLIELRAREAGINIPASNQAVRYTPFMTLSPNGAMTLALDHRGALVMGTPLGDLTIFESVTNVLAQRLMARLTGELGLKETLPLTTDGEIVDQKVYAITRSPDGLAIEMPIVNSLNQSVPPFTQWVETWNRNKPDSREEVTLPARSPLR